MIHIKTTTIFFLLSLSLGTYLFLPISNTKETGAGFLRLNLAITLISQLLAFIMLFSLREFYPFEIGVHAFSMAIGCFLYWRAKESKPLDFKLASILYILTLLFCGWFFLNKAISDWLYWISASLLLGIVNYAMVLGHWYLVVPKMSEKPLKICMQLMWGILILKMILTGQSYLNSSQFFMQGTSDGFGYMFNWIMFSMRLLWGYLALIVLSYFTWRLVCMRSIQSATGILYVMVFFVLVGEIIAAYFFASFGFYL